MQEREENPVEQRVADKLVDQTDVTPAQTSSGSMVASGSELSAS